MYNVRSYGLRGKLHLINILCYLQGLHSSRTAALQSSSSSVPILSYKCMSLCMPKLCMCVCVCVDCYLQGGLGKKSQKRCSNMITGYNKNQCFFQFILVYSLGRRRKEMFWGFFKGIAFYPPNSVCNHCQLPCVWTFESALQNLTWWKLTLKSSGDNWKTHWKASTLISS